jgi:hypothetical protein
MAMRNNIETKQDPTVLMAYKKKQQPQENNGDEPSGKRNKQTRKGRKRVDGVRR